MATKVKPSIAKSRLEDEVFTIAKKINTLENFINNRKVCFADTKYALLPVQLNAMKCYSSILAIRLFNWQDD